jgi:hypothetical protein
LGTVGNFVATVYFTDGYAEDISNKATWVSSNASVVQIAASGPTGGSASANKIGDSAITTTFAGLTATTNTTVTPAVLTEIYITPVTSSIKTGDKTTYNAVCKYSDGSFHDLPNHGSWQSSNSNIANIQYRDNTTTWALGVNEGQAKITAHVGNIVSNEATLTVVAPTKLTSIQVTPAEATTVIETEGQFTAIAYYSDGSDADITTQATWLSDDTDIVGLTITGDEKGYAYARQLGEANVTATFEKIQSNEAHIIVIAPTLKRVQITPNNKNYKVGDTAQYYVNAIYDDYSSQDITSYSRIQSNDLTVATFNENNVMTATAAGDIELSTVYQGMTSEIEFLHVDTASTNPPTIEISPANIEVPQGSTINYTATRRYENGKTQDITDQVIWSSADTNIINIQPTGSTAGQALAVSAGNTLVIGTFQGITSNTGIITVKSKELLSIEIIAEDDASFPKGTTKYYTAFANYDDESVIEITQDAVWKSDNTEVVVVVKGLVYGVDVGDSNINISFEGKKSTQRINVTDAVIRSLTITPSYHEMAVHSTVDYIVTAALSDGTTENVTKDVHKSSTGEAELSIIYQEKELLTIEGITSGQAILQANYQNRSATANIVILAATLESISVTPLDETISSGSTIQYQAYAHYSNGSTVNITEQSSWYTSNTTIASINTHPPIGLVSGIAPGIVTIQATFNDIKAKTNLTIGNDCGKHKPERIYIRPDNAIISVNTEMHYTLFGLWPDNCIAELTENNANNWSSADSKVVSIGKKSGKALAKKVGKTFINADYQSLSAVPVSISVTGEEVLSVSIQPAPSAILSKGDSLNYICSARTSVNGVEQAEKFVTGIVTFNSSNEEVAVIAHNDGTFQTINAQHLIGNSTITCKHGGKESSSSLKVQ